MKGLVKRFFSKGKKVKAGILMAAIMLMSVSSAFAADPVADTSTVTAVTNGMSSIQMTALAVVAAVAGVAVALFAAPFAWQYGKKIFKTVAR